MSAHAYVCGLVPAGGRAVRFGRDKRVEPFGRSTLVGTAVSKLRSVVAGEIYVATGACAERLAGAAGAVAVRDEPPGRGPLGGIAAGMLRARFGLLVLAPDVPLVRIATLAHIRQIGVECGRPVALRSAAGWEPLVAFYPRAIFHDIRAAIQVGMLAPHKLLDRLGAIGVAADPKEVTNVNRTEDLARVTGAAGAGAP